MVAERSKPSSPQGSLQSKIEALIPAIGTESLDVIAQVPAMLGEGVMIVQPTGKVVWSNENARRMLGLTVDQLAGRSPLADAWQAVRLDGSPVPRHEHPAPRALALGEPVIDSVMGIRNGDAVVWLSVNATPTTLNGHAVAISVFTEITREFEQRQTLDRTLTSMRRTLIQPDVPSTSRVHFAARYKSAGTARFMGGDFFGASQFDANRYGFFIGDVCGHGPQATGLSLLARNTLRTAGPLLNDPSKVLRHLHNTLLSERPDTYLTAIYGYVDTRPGAATVRLAIGGHPLPLLIHRGADRSVGEPGAIVGMVQNQDRPVVEFDVEPRDQLLLYTDGLISTRHREVEAIDLFASLPKTLMTDVLADVALGLAETSGPRSDDDDASVMVVGFH